MNSKSQVTSQYIAEFIGTFFLVFFGCLSIVQAQKGSIPTSAIPFVFGGTVAIMVYATGHISGAHFNPAVTISFWIAKHFPTPKVLFYILSQTAGAILAAFLVKIFATPDISIGQTVISTNITEGIIIEFVMSFVLMFVILSVATDTRAVGELAGIAIGSTVTICAFVGGAISGASMNPARSLGPAIASTFFDNIAIYIFVPIVGAICGAMTYKWIKCPDNKDVQHGCC